MLASALFHTFLCHSPGVTKFWLSCDRVSLHPFLNYKFLQAGILFSIFGTYIRILATIFPCHPLLRATHLIVVCLLFASSPQLPSFSWGKGGKVLPRRLSSSALHCMQWHPSPTLQLSQKAQSVSPTLYGCFSHTSRWPPSHNSFMTASQYKGKYLCGASKKILRSAGCKKKIFHFYHLRAEIHSFPAMYNTWGASLDRNGSE